jgi:hypothetical protein
MGNSNHITANPAKRSPILERLVAGAVLLAGAWLLDRLVAERASQLLILSWILAATACGLALRSERAGRHWWAWPAWMLAASGLCFLAGLLTLES